MAIQVKMSNLNGVAALKKLGLPSEGCDSLMAQGIAVKLTAKAFSFQKADGSQGADIPVTLDQLQKLNAGTLPMSDKVKLQTQVSDAIASLGGSIKGVASPMAGLPQMNVNLPKQPSEQLMAALKSSAQTGAQQIEEVPISTAVEALQKVAKPSPGPKVNLGVTGPLNPPIGMVAKGGGAALTWPRFPKAKLLSAGMTKLRDATQMYQPVFGTSSGSRYFMVAANDDVRVAARLDGGTLSVRIEGPNWTKYASGIAECGFSNIDKSKGYASMHLHVGEDKKMASKTLGAILTGLGITLETPIPDLKYIYG